MENGNKTHPIVPGGSMAGLLVARPAHRDAKLSIAFHQVANLLAGPESLMHPCNIARVV